MISVASLALTINPAIFLLFQSIRADQRKRKDVYQINAIDEATQFQIIVTLEPINGFLILPALKQILMALPVKLSGFRIENHRRHIHDTDAQLLGRLYIELTESCYRPSDENCLVKSKSAAVICKRPRPNTRCLQAHSEIEEYFSGIRRREALFSLPLVLI